MGDLVVKRTLVKSPPELWTEVSEVERLARHIGELGNIRISRLDPERTVAWEGELASGTVEIEASGWGTRVILTAEVEEEAPAPADVTVAEPEAKALAGPESSTEVEVQAPAEPEPEAPVEPEAEPEAEARTELEAAAEPRASAEPPAEADAATKATLANEPEPPAGEPWAAAEKPDPEPLVAPVTPKRRGFFARWLFRDRRAAPKPPPAATSPAPEPVVAKEPRPAPAAPAGALAAPEPEPAPEPEHSAPDDANPTIDSTLGRPATTSREDSPPEPPGPPTPEPEPEPAQEPEAKDTTDPPDSERVRVVFEAALDSLGSAHHRPFSRG